MEDHILLVSSPSRYLGGEINSVRKNLSEVDIKVCLAFPDVYEVGMSHLGLQILYHLLNSVPGIAAERVYAPGLDMEAVMREKGILLSSLESRCPVRNFDVVGFSLQYELSYTTLLTMLDLAGIPLYASHRTDDYPLVIAGGPCAFNPEPLADFFDAFVIGDGEEVLREVCECIIGAKKKRIGKDGMLHLLSRIGGVYIPQFFEPVYHESGMMQKIVPLKPGYERVKKRWVKSLDTTPLVERPLVPYRKIVHDRLNLEIARGCSRGCRFCQAGIIYRPVRERGMDIIEKMVELSLASTGFDEISLASLSTGDHSCIAELLPRLMARYASEKVAISFPSVRSETLTPQLMEEIKKVRKTGFTIAPEAGSERLRRIINKGITEEEILETVNNVFAAGWNGIKLYFMVGLPSENHADLEGIVDLVRRIRSLAGRGGKRGSVAVSVSTFVPKAHTPFQWEPQIGIEEMQRRQDFLKHEIRKLNLTFKWQDVRMSYLEGIFARGDRRLSAVMERAYRLGCRFDGWSEHLDYDKWERALQGIDKDFYTTRRRYWDEILPWEHIDCAVSKDYLWAEYQKALEGIFTTDCRRGLCHGCGVCSDEDRSRILRARGIEDGAQHAVCRTASVPTGSSVGMLSEAHACQRLRLRFAKLGMGRFLGHLELVTLFARAIKRAKIPVRFSEGFHPLPRVTFGPALPVGIESECEYVDIEVTGHRNALDILSALNLTLPDWIRIREVEEIPLKYASISDSISQVSYLADLHDYHNKILFNNKCIEAKLHNYNEDKERLICIKSKSGMTQVDLKEWLEEIALKGGDMLEMVVKMRGGRTIRPYEVLKNIIGLSDENLHAVAVKKIGVQFRNRTLCS